MAVTRVMIPRFYFGEADLQMTPFIGYEQFRFSLLYHLLFQGRLIVTDGFWFMSDHLKTEVLSDPDASFLLAGLRSGLVRPWFRERVGGSFAKGLDVIKQQGIIGLGEGSDAAAEVLDHTVRDSPAYRWGHWRKDRLVGGRFHREVLNALGKAEPPAGSAEAESIWEHTKAWRTECVEIALARTRDGTLRRGELLDVVGRRVGWDGKAKVRNAAVLLASVPEADRPTLKTFLHWVNQCYQRNQATSFAMDVSLRSGSGLEQLGAFATLPTGDDARDCSVLALSTLAPSLRGMLALPPEDVLRPALSEEGRSYFRAYGKWRQDPSEQNGMEARECLALYCTALTETFRELRGDVLEAWFGVGRQHGRTRFSLGSAFGLISLVPVVGASAWVFRTAWGLMRLYAPGRYQALEDLAIGARKRHVVRLKSRLPTGHSVNVAQDP